MHDNNLVKYSIVSRDANIVIVGKITVEGMEKMDDKKLIKALEFGDEKMECIKPIEFGEGKIFSIRAIEFSNEDFRVNNSEKMEYDKANTDALLNIGNLENQIITKTEMFNNSKVIHSTSKSALLQKEYNIINGILHITELNGELIEICNFKVEAISTIIEDDGINQNTKHVMKCYLENDTKGERVIINSNELNEKSWIARKLGIKYTLSPNKLAYEYFKQYLSEIFSFIKPQVEYTHVGWRFINNKWCYLNSAGAIGLTDSDIRGDKNKILEIDYYLTKVEALKRALNMLEIADNDKTLPLFLYAHLGVMNEVFNRGNVKIQFTLWMVGVTGSRKTTLAKLFFNLFNRSKDYITATFKDSVAAIEMKSFEFKDSVLVLDDFHPASSSEEKKQMNQIASEIIRRYGDGICRARMTKNMTKQKEFPPRGLAVITGEDTYGVLSTALRYIKIEINHNDIDLEKLSYHQKNPLGLSTHLYYFIEWVSNNFNDIVAYISENFTIRRMQNIKLFKHGRLADALAIYQIQIEIFLEYCNEMGVFDNAQEVENCWNDVIFNIIKEYDMANINKVPSTMYIVAIQNLVESNKIKLIKKGEDLEEGSIGYRDDKKLYLNPKLAYSEVRSFWKLQGLEFSISDEQVHKELDALGLIEVQLENRQVGTKIKTIRRRTVKISGYSKRLLVIDIEEINKVLNSLE